MRFKPVLTLLAAAAVVHPILLAQVFGQGGQQPRRPRGIYAVVPIEDVIKQQQKTNSSVSELQLDAYFAGLYGDLLNNPALAGLALQVHWDTVNPNPPGTFNAYDWSYVDVAFADVAIWNLFHPFSPPKTIQLIVSAGFETPSWVYTKEAISPCDGLFNPAYPAPEKDCGSVTFQNYGEGGDSNVLPVPWNQAYRSAWKTFLTALNARYGWNPAFVSIAVAGPTAASVEIILPNDGNTPAQPAPTKKDPANTIQPNAIWELLLTNAELAPPGGPYSDGAFIAAWKDAIDAYGEIFNGVTLIVTTGSGLPNFNGVTAPSPPAALSGDCTTVPTTLDCYSETEIEAYFMTSTVGGNNAKATQTSGMKASREAGDLGIDGVKNLSELTASFSSSSAQVLGGSQFDRGFSGNSTVDEGCTSPFPPNNSDTPPGCANPNATPESALSVACVPAACFAPGFDYTTLPNTDDFGMIKAKDLISPEQAAYNVLKIYFDKTPVAATFGATPGAAPLNYLQVYYQDFQYAGTNVDSPAPVVEAGGTVSVTAQYLLNVASQKLFTIAEGAASIPWPF